MMINWGWLSVIVVIGIVAYITAARIAARQFRKTLKELHELNRHEFEKLTTEEAENHGRQRNLLILRVDELEEKLHELKIELHSIDEVAENYGQQRDLLILRVDELEKQGFPPNK